MRDRELYQQILGLSSPWKVDDIRLSLADRQVVVVVVHELGVPLQEHKALRADGGDSILTNTKHHWSRNSERADNRSWTWFMALTGASLKTAQAWAIKEQAGKLWRFTSRTWAEKGWRRLLGWMDRCHLAPVKKVASTIKNHLWGILNAVVTASTNATGESLNARIQKIKAMACGCGNRTRFRRTILFHLGGLDLMPAGASYPTHTKARCPTYVTLQFRFIFMYFGIHFSLQAEELKFDFSAVSSPIIFRGDATTAYRDPAVIYNNGLFYLYYEVIKIEADKKVFIYTAWSKSSDLVRWTAPKIFTARDQTLNYGSPGGVTRFGEDWILCLQIYPRPNGERYGNKDSRIWIMRSKDLENWGPAELLAVLGPNVSQEKMGRMIDPFLIEDKAEPGKWWCFFKQIGQVSLSWSRDLKTWNTTPIKVANGENPGAIVDGTEYVLCYAPSNGIGIKRSSDLKEWRDEGILHLGQKEWPWAQGRLTAGFILDLRKNPQMGKAIMVFHGSQYPEADPRGGFDNFASIGIAWSRDLKSWEWPGKDVAKP